jgi:hypothetical protein
VDHAVVCDEDLSASCLGHPFSNMQSAHFIDSIDLFSFLLCSKCGSSRDVDSAPRPVLLACHKLPTAELTTHIIEAHTVLLWQHLDPRHLVVSIHSFFDARGVWDD